MNAPTLGQAALALSLCASAAGSLANTPYPDAPSVPDNVRAAVNGDSIRVEWDASSDDRGVVGYNLYRDGRYHVTVFGTGYTDHEVEPDRRYAYQVTAYDETPNYTPSSEPANVTASRLDGRSAASRLPDTPASPSAAAQDDGDIRLSWAPVAGEVDGYNVYRDDRYVTTVRDTEWVDADTEAGRLYRYYLVAFSHRGRFSGKSEPTEIRIAQDAPALPAAPERRLADRSDAASPGGAPDGYTLVFSDEFRDRTIDASKWNTRYRWGPDWIINNELQYYVDVQDERRFGRSPFSFDGEHLTISASRTPAGLLGAANSQRWLSGAMTTFGHFAMTYGYVEMRARLPRGQGMWPAFWLLHERDTADRPEIDVVELLGGDTDTVYQTYHWYQDRSLRSTPSFRVEQADYAAGFHTYAMRWEPGRIIWYVDGRETHRFDSERVAAESMYLLLNLAVGGSWGGSPDGSTPDRVDFTIDYIRAYRRDGSVTVN